MLNQCKLRIFGVIKYIMLNHVAVKPFRVLELKIGSQLWGIKCKSKKKIVMIMNRHWYKRKMHRNISSFWCQFKCYMPWRNIGHVIAPNPLQRLTNVRKQISHPSICYCVTVCWNLKYNTLKKITSAFLVEVRALQVDLMNRCTVMSTKQKCVLSSQLM